MITKLAFLFTWVIIILVSCSDFYSGGISHGSIIDPKSDTIIDTIVDTIPADTVIDTILIPSDSIVVPLRFPINDTLLHGEFSFHSKRTGSLQFDLQDTANLAEVTLYGDVICSAPLNLFMNQSTAWDSLTIDSSGGIWHHRFRIALQTGQNATMEWNTNFVGPYSITLLALVGYERQIQESLNIPKNAKTAEYQVIAKHNRDTLAAFESSWLGFQAYAGDSLVGVVASDSGIQTWILTASTYTAYTSFGTMPNSFVYNHANDGDTLQYEFTTPGNFGYVVHNETSDSLAVQDLVRIYRPVVSN